jgi:hypothetical protein
VTSNTSTEDGAAEEGNEPGGRRPVVRDQGSRSPEVRDGTMGRR